VTIRACGAAALIALCAAGGAQAKGPDLARACGASGCSTVRGDVRVYTLIDWTYSEFTIATVPKPAPFYRITLRDHGKVFMTFLYVPALKVVRVWQPGFSPRYAPGSWHPYWRPVNAEGAAAFRRALAGLKPFSAPHAWR
jgi:hypothetical protein